MKLFVKFSILFALATGAANAVTVTLIGLANGSPGIGNITAGGSNVSGTALFVTSATQFSSADFSGIASAAGDSSAVQSAVSGLASDLGVVRTVAFSNGLLTSTGATELGAVGNNVYLFLVSDDGNSYGAFQSVNDVPSLGAVNINANTAGDFTGFGTSTGGFQLVTVPEPSIAVLGALGILGLVRRRR